MGFYIFILLPIIFLIIYKASSPKDKNGHRRKKSDSQTIETSNNVKHEEGKTFVMEFENSTTNEPFFIIVDVETTGLFRSKEVTERNYKRFPRIVQIAWILLDREYKWIEGKEYIIKQEKEIPFESTLIHHITDEIAAERGEDLLDVLHEFNDDLKKCKLLVAHNIEFDFNIIKAEMMRTKTSSLYLDVIAQYCTMLWSIDICKITSYNRSSYDYKYPKLEELVKYFFFNNNQHYRLSGFHNAVEDAKWTAHCLPLLLGARGQNVDNFRLVDLTDVEIPIEEHRLIKESRNEEVVEISAKELSAARAFLSRNKNKLSEYKSNNDNQQYHLLLNKMQERYNAVITGGHVFKEDQEKEFESLGIKVWKI